MTRPDWPERAIIARSVRAYGLSSDGTIHYDKGDINAQLQALSAGDTLTDTFTYAIQLGNGTLSWATVTLQFAGLNDAPIIVVGSTTASAAFSEAANTTGSSTPDQAGGTIVFSDVDAHDTHTVSQSGPSFAWSSGALTSVHAAALTAASNLNLVASDSTNVATATGSVKWTYSAADKAFDFLAAGETLTVTYTVTIDDGHGGTVIQPVTVTVTGTNDQPTIVPGSTTATGSIMEAAGATGSATPDTARLAENRIFAEPGNPVNWHQCFSVGGDANAAHGFRHVALQCRSRALTDRAIVDH